MADKNEPVIFKIGNDNYKWADGVKGFQTRVGKVATVFDEKKMESWARQSEDKNKKEFFKNLLEKNPSLFEKVNGTSSKK